MNKHLGRRAVRAVKESCMLKRIGRFLNIIMGCSVGVFIGHGIYKYWHYRKYSDLYVGYSAPWYTDILLYGVITLIVLAVCFILKMVFRIIAQTIE